MSSLIMLSFDIKALFTNILLTGTLNICVQNFYRNQTHVGNLTKISFYSLFKITIFESFFILDKIFFWTIKWRSSGLANVLTLFRMGFLGSAHGWGRGQKVPLSKICHTSPTMMKLCSYTLPKEDQKNIWIWHQHFFTGNHQILLYQEIQI